MKKIYVVTINFNTQKETHGLLASLRKIKKEGFELFVVVIDNASKIPFDLTSLEKNENVHTIRSEENTGFTGGNNIGIKYALDHQADYVLIINNDTFVEKNFLNELLKVINSNKDIGVVVPKIYFAKGHEFHKERYKNEELGRVIWYAGGFIDWNNVVSVHIGVDDIDNGQFENRDEINFATGCAMLIKKEVIEKAGMFDNRFFLYFEDADLSQRILRKGYKIIFVPSAIIWHINAGSSGSGSALHDYFITRNRMLFGMRYASLRSKIALIKESVRLFFLGRPMQKKALKDFYLQKFGKGTYFT